jgi:hypothetical protein
MKRSRPLRPSPALVIACLALFVALGGTVLAATKIDGKTIRVKSLPGNRLEPGSVPGNRIVPGSLDGTRIKAATLGEVPSAAHAGAADSARHADTATAADHATDASTVNGHTVGCPSGRKQFAGACWDIQPSSVGVNVLEAETSCAAVGGTVPDLLSLVAFVQQPGVAIVAGGEWTSSEQTLGIDSFAFTTLEGGSHVNIQRADAPYRFRCVTPLLH